MSEREIELWVKRLNRLAAKMDHICDGVHPSAWEELTRKEREEWKRIVGMGGDKNAKR